MICKLTFRPVRVRDIPFDERTPVWCEKCEMRGKSLTCPPYAEHGRLARTLQARRDGFLIAFDCAYRSPGDLAAIRDETREYLLRLRDRHPGSLAVGTAACTVCAPCACPGECRFPEKRLYPMEAYCVIVAELAARCGLSMDAGDGRIRFFALLLH